MESGNSEKKPDTRITKQGLGHRPILQSQLLAAREKTKSAAEAARLLGISYNTFKKYSRIYGIFEQLKNQAGIGIDRARHSKNRKYAIDDLLANKYPKYPLHKFKSKLFNSGYIPRACTVCGHSEERLSDGKQPLLLDFLDGNLNNRNLENIRPLCYNCFFLLVGNRKEKHFQALNNEENEQL